VNSLVQQLFKSCQRPVRVISPPSQEELDNKIKLVTLLLENSNTTHLDFYKLLHLGREPCRDFFRLALQNCPKLVSLKSPTPFVDEDHHLERLRVLELVSEKWQNLTCLDLCGLTIFDDAMELLKNKMQRLR